jgi:hypothetical protein
MTYYDTRSSSLHVFGNTTDELEAAALEKAQKEFGSDVQLAPDRSYELVHRIAETAIEWPEGMSLMATIRIRVINEPNPAFVDSRSKWRRLLETLSS